MKITGIKKIATESKSLMGTYGPVHLQVLYDLETGEAWASPRVGESWIMPRRGIVECGELWYPTKMADIKAMIEEAVEGDTVEKRRAAEFEKSREEMLKADREYWNSINA